MIHMISTEVLEQVRDALAIEDSACHHEKEATPEHIAKALTSVNECLAKPWQESVVWDDTKQSELNDWFLSLPEGRQAVLLEDKWMLAGAAYAAGKAAAAKSSSTSAHGPWVTPTHVDGETVCQRCKAPAMLAHLVGCEPKGSSS